MTKISVNGILISIFIGIVFGLKMQDDYLFRNAGGQADNMLRQVVSPVAKAQSEESMEQELTDELDRYMKNNFNFSTLKTHWAQYIDGYEVSIENETVFVAVRTSLTRPDSNSNYILNAVQGFVRSRLPDGYIQGHIMIYSQKGKVLTDRDVALEKRERQRALP
ncbi:MULTISPECIES: hypothetical protein [Aneurinibacillus]|uniref:Uncharacterized protein n=1 Tax=Aneurinibacillus danicus TaxID=267746 RepID=A0A511V0W8_9BACL|nr:MULTISPECIES: hypothetical protein [Aneurinibacillus]GEN32557.1 hypothetical protein ADA01nite_00170 [Aneurinibacillus danicus]